MLISFFNTSFFSYVGINARVRVMHFVQAIISRHESRDANFTNRFYINCDTYYNIYCYIIGTLF